MTNLPANLRAACEAEATRYAQAKCRQQGEYTGGALEARIKEHCMHMAEFIYRHLLTSAPEFDENAAADSTPDDSFWWMRGARWQHTQMAAQVAAYEANNKEAWDDANRRHRDCQALIKKQIADHAEIARLRAQIKELEHQLKMEQDR